MSRCGRLNHPHSMTDLGIVAQTGRSWTVAALHLPFDQRERRVPRRRRLRLHLQEHRFAKSSLRGAAALHGCSSLSQ